MSSLHSRTLLQARLCCVHVGSQLSAALWLYTDGCSVGSQLSAALWLCTDGCSVGSQLSAALWLCTDGCCVGSQLSAALWLYTNGCCVGSQLSAALWLYTDGCRHPARCRSCCCAYWWRPGISRSTSWWQPHVCPSSLIRVWHTVHFMAFTLERDCFTEHLPSSSLPHSEFFHTL